jgi:hypothetical protein
MTEQEFWNVLQRTNGWTLRDGCVRREIDGVVECPITAVAHEIAGKPFNYLEPGKAERESGMNLDMAFSLKLIYAADGFGRDFEVAQKLMEVAQKLMEVTGLEEPR